MGFAVSSDASKGSMPAIDVKDFQGLYNHGVERRDHRGLDLSIPKGIIYGLIGDSYDSTLLLEYIVGIRNCPGSRIRVLGQVPGTQGASVPGPDVGYAKLLPPELTVRQTLRWMGQIHGMPDPKIQQRIETLSELLSLPDGTRSVAQAYDEEADLVTLAAAIFHSPPLLILDGALWSTDPSVKKKVWDYLRRLTREEGVTVLFAGLYVEEIRFRADMVGIMCSGRIVAQGSPQQLLNDFRCDTLEEVYLQLSLANEEKPIVQQERLDELIITGGIANVGDQDLEKHSFLMKTVKRHRCVLVSLRRVLMLSKMNFSLSRRKSFPQTLFILLALYVVIFLVPFVPVGPTSPTNNTLNASSICSANTPDADREMSVTGFSPFGLAFSFIFGTNLLTTMIGTKFRFYTDHIYLRAGVKPHEIIASSLVLQFCLMLVQTTVMTAPVVLDSTSSCDPGTVALFIVFFFLQGFQGMAWGMFASLPRFSKHASSCIGIFVFCANTVLSGTIMPLSDGAFILWRVVSMLMPQKYPAESLRCLTARGCDDERNEVWIGILASIGWSALIACVVIKERCDPRQRWRLQKSIGI